MKRSPALAKAQKKYERETIDHIYIRAPKGFRARIKAAAEKEGLSMNAYVMRILSDAIGASPTDDRIG